MTFEDRLAVIGAVAIVCVGIAVVLWFIRHPCLESVTRKAWCGGDMYCVFQGTDGVCQMWNTNPRYECEIEDCVRREP